MNEANNNGTEIIAQVFRHPAMGDTERDYVTKKEEEILLDEKLGLKNQTKYDRAYVFQKDIDELTSSNDYVQINDRILNRMFSINKLKRMYFLYNVKVITLFSINTFYKPVICLIMFLIYVYNVVSIFKTYSILTASIFASLIISAIIVASIFSILSAINVFKPKIDRYNNEVEDSNRKYELIKVTLASEDVKTTEVKLPYGVKLKLNDAVDSRIFAKFIIAYPQVRSENMLVVRPSDDPALIGITDDNRRFMICWWDQKNDVDKVRKDIKWLKKYKIET